MNRKLTVVFFLLSVASVGGAFHFFAAGRAWRIKYEELRANTTKATDDARRERESLRQQAAEELGEIRTKYEELRASTTQIADDARREHESLRQHAAEELGTLRTKYEDLQANVSKVVESARREGESLRQQAAEELDKARQTKAIAEQEQAAALAMVKSAADVIRNKELFKIYPDLRPFASTTNTVNDRYVASFSAAGATTIAHGTRGARTVSITYQNNSDTPVKPNVKIYFINEFGLVTGYASDSWSFDSIRSGERRIEDCSVAFEHGPPVYWRIEVK